VNNNFHDPRLILKKYGLYPKKGLGQNFLISPKVLRTILQASEITPQDTILEIGPGTGVLTHHLAAARCVVAIELDETLVQILRQELAQYPNIHIVQGNILEIEHPQLVAELCGIEKNYKIIGNLPYYITSHAIRRFLEIQPSPSLVIIMVQKEVAERITATPPKMSLLAVSVQYYAIPEMVTLVRRTAFIPPPEVDSAVLRLRVREHPLFPDIPSDIYFRIVSAGFAQKRKSLLNSLSSSLNLPKSRIATLLDKASIDHNVRAEQLTLEDWARICRQLMECESYPTVR